MTFPFEFGVVDVHSFAFIAAPLLGSIERDISHWFEVPLALVIVAMVALRKWGKQKMGQRKEAADTHFSVPRDP